MKWYLRALGVILLGAMVAGCAREEAAVETGAPEGWQADGDRWWRAGIDTARAFRNLETFSTMGVSGQIYLATPGNLGPQQQFERRMRHAFIRLYRNQPEIVDSLFTRLVLPKLPAANASDDMARQVERAKRQSYKQLRRHFQEPQTALQLGTDVPVPYPDSLRARQIGGPVKLQVYLDAEGAPLAIELLEGVHPTLDAIALRATTEMRWRPAYLISKGRWSAIPAWARFTVRFTPG